MKLKSLLAGRVLWRAAEKIERQTAFGSTVL